VPENNGLCDPGGGGDFLSGWCLGSLAREEVEAVSRSWTAAVLGGEALGSVAHGTIVSQRLLTCQYRSFERWAFDPQNRIVRDCKAPAR